MGGTVENFECMRLRLMKIGKAGEKHSPAFACRYTLVRVPNERWGVAEEIFCSLLRHTVLLTSRTHNDSDLHPLAGRHRTTLCLGVAALPPHLPGAARPERLSRAAPPAPHGAPPRRVSGVSHGTLVYAPGLRRRIPRRVARRLRGGPHRCTGLDFGVGLRRRSHGGAAWAYG